MNWWLVWIIIFLIVLFGVSLVSSKKIKTADDFMMADFSLGFFPIAGTVVATVSGSAALIGAAGKGYEIGISFWITSLSLSLFSLALVFLLAPAIRKLKLYTIPDLFFRRFGKTAALIPALVIGFMYMTPTFGMQLVGMSSILTSIIDLPVTWGILIGFTISVIFTLMGGMVGVAWTDAIQTVVILAGVIIMFFMGLSHVGGVEVLKQETPKHLLNFFSIGWKELLNWFLIYGPFYFVWQTTWQRISAAKTAKTAKWSLTVGFLLAAAIKFMAILIGVMAIHALSNVKSVDNIYTQFMVELFPASIGGLFMVSLLAALLTSATSFLLSGSINISKDIYQTWINPNAEDKQVLKIARASVLGMAVLGLIIALTITDIIGIYQLALSFTAVALFAPVLAAFFWKRATKTGVLASIIVSMIIAAIWNFADKPFGIHEIAPGLVTSFLILIVVSLFTKHSHDENVTAYFFELKNKLE